MISYRLNLELFSKEVRGYSITNIGGPYETKSYVEGRYYPENDVLEFKEYGIEYTKSNVESYDFCFVHFSGKVKKIEKQDIIKGRFLGKYDDGVSCIDGEILVKSIEKIYEKAEKTNKKIERLEIISDSIKNSVDMVKTIDEKRLNIIKSDEKISVFCTSDMIKLKIWDAGKIDGDRITLMHNGKIILKNHTVSENHKIIDLTLDKNINRISLLAENEGSIEPNTAKIELIDGDRVIEMLSNLNSSEKTTLLLHRLNN